MFRWADHRNDKQIVHMMIKYITVASDRDIGKSSGSLMT